MLLEVCANSYKSAKNAQEAGAHRIELCQELSVGGLTPSYGLLDKVLSELKIIIFVLIRPRSGDFVYSDAEFDIMKRDIQKAKKMGCHGIVSGVLKDDKTIDIDKTKELIELSKPLAFTFHRAFDEVKNPEKTLEQLIHLGAERILTSGQQASAEKGLALIEELQNIAGNRITILPGGGINSNNASKFKEAGLREIHASASVKMEQEHSLFGMEQTVSDLNKIKAILDEIL